MTFRFVDLVGRYALVVSPELVQFIEQAFVAPAAVQDREVMRAEALNEARGSELRVSDDGQIVSSSHGHELFRTRIAPPEGEVSEITFDKPEWRVKMWMTDRDTVVAEQPGKPLAKFERVTPSE